MAAILNDENLPGFPGFASDFRGFPEWVLPIKTASTVHKTSKILLFFEFLLFYVCDDVTIRKISGFFFDDHSHLCILYPKYFFLQKIGRFQIQFDVVYISV
jgi:hypothetical protein